MEKRGYVVREVSRIYYVMPCTEQLPEDDYRLNILISQSLPGFVDFKSRVRDGKTDYYYDITDCRPFLSVTDASVKGGFIDRLVRGLCRVTDTIEEYLLDENDLVLEKDAIFCDEKGEVLLLYYPAFGQRFSDSLRKLAQDLLADADYTDSVSVKKVYGFYHLTTDPEHIMHQLRSFFVEEKSDDRLICQPAPEVITPDMQADPTEGKLRRLSVDMLPPGLRPARNTPEEPQEKDPETSEETHTRRLCMIVGAAAAASCALSWNVLHGPLRLSMTVGIALGGAFGIVILYTVLSRRQMQESFWAPEDFVNYDSIPSYGSDCAQTTVLGKHGSRTEETKALLLQSIQPGLTGDLAITRFPAEVGKSGKDPSCRIQHDTVSRKHLRIEQEQGVFFVTDLGSTNGSRINGLSLRAGCPSPLSDGDRLELADLSFIVRI